MPGSPEMSTTQPSPSLASSHRRSNSSISSSRPTSGVVVARSASKRPSAAPSPSACHAAHVLSETFERNDAEIAIFEQSAGQATRALRDHHRARRGDGLEPGGQIRRLADHRLLLRRAGADQIADDDKAGGDPDADLQGTAGDGIEPRRSVDQSEPGAHRALGVVLWACG